MKPKTTQLFCYGTLLDPRIQEALWHSCKAGPIAVVPGHHILHGDYPRLRSCPQEGNPGAVGRVLSLTAHELKLAIIYEGPDYSLGTVELEDGSTVACFL